MNRDRRTKAPSSVPYHVFRQKAPKVELAARADGRQDDTLKPRVFDINLVADAAGSGYVEHGRSKVIAAVLGPREVVRRREFTLQARLRCVFQFAPYAMAEIPAGGCNRIAMLEERNSQWLEEALRPVVHLRRYPKAAIDIQVICLENDGGALACALTACGLALASSGIETFDIVIGVHLRSHAERLLMDPSREEEDLPAPAEGSFGNVTLGFLPVLRQVTGLLQTGDTEPARLAQEVESLVKVADRVAVAVNDCLRRLVKMQQDSIAHTTPDGQKADKDEEKTCDSL